MGRDLHVNQLETRAMENKPYTPKLPANQLPKAPHQMTDAELDAPCPSPEMQQEKQHRKLCSRIDLLSGGQEKLKQSVDRLGRPRWIDWAILVAGGIAAVATVIELFRAH